MVQIVIVALLFVGASSYLGRILYKQFRPVKNGCAGECKCDSKVAATPKP